MANFYGTTASNGAKIKADKVEECQKFLDKFENMGDDGQGECVEAYIDDEKCLHLYGYSYFTPLLAIEEDEEREEYDNTDEFIEGIAQFLEEPLVIHSVGNEKCRFPLSAWECKINPDGTVENNGFKHFD